MENFWNKTGSLILGLLLGALSGFLSVYQLSLDGAFIRPPLVFGVVALVCWSFVLRISLPRIILLFFLFQVAYFLVILLGTVFTGFYLIGAALVFVAVALVLQLHERMLLLKLLPLFLVLGLFFDTSYPWLDDILSADLPPQLFGQGKDAKAVFKLAIFIWQMSAITIIALQLHIERRYRQRVAAQEQTEGGSPTP